MPFSVTQRHRGPRSRDHHLAVAQTQSQTWKTVDKFHSHEIRRRRRIRDRSGVEEQPGAGGGRGRHKLKAQLVTLARLQGLQDNVAAVAGQSDLRLLAAGSFEADWARTAAAKQYFIYFIIVLYSLYSNRTLITH